LRIFAAKILMSSDWSSFNLRITIDATVRAIYDAWAMQAGLEKWFPSSAEFTTPEGNPREPHDRIQAGDTYLWKWYGFPGGAPESGTILEANGYDRLRFAFTDRCIVTVSVKNEGGEKVMELTQENIPADEKLGTYLGCSTGWIFYMTNLKSILEGGIDLRNKNENIGGVLNA
jgi:uncharacterized protein YndB with AHSA1/START domain